MCCQAITPHGTYRAGIKVATAHGNVNVFSNTDGRWIPNIVAACCCCCCAPPPQGQLPPSTEFDVFRGVPPKRRDAEEKVPKKKHGTIKFGKDSHADSAIFTPDGRHLITGSVDGFVEVWNPDTGKLNKELDYQAEVHCASCLRLEIASRCLLTRLRCCCCCCMAQNRFMMHDDSVLCLDVSQDSDLLATASRSGKIKVWDLTTGKCVRKFLKAHEEGVTSVSFSRAGTLLLSTSFDHTARYCSPVCVCVRE